MNHYDVLGVARTASDAEIRSAFRQAARDAHPDRHGDASAARMSAVNEAWRVLGDPVRRRRYDLELADDERPAGGSAARSSGVVARPEPRPPVVPTGDLSRFPWRFFATIGVVAIVFVFVGNTLTDPAPPAPVDNILLPGECVDIDDLNARSIVPVSCAADHDAEVVEIVDFDPGTCPTGTESFLDPQGRGNACITRTGPASTGAASP